MEKAIGLWNFDLSWDEQPIDVLDIVESLLFHGNLRPSSALSSRQRWTIYEQFHLRLLQLLIAYGYHIAFHILFVPTKSNRFQATVFSFTLTTQAPRDSG